MLLLAIAAGSHAGSNTVRDADDSRISVTAVAGNVEFTMAGNAVAVSPNSTVVLPARIVTGHDGNVGLTQAGTNISVSSDTDVEIPAEAVDGNLVARLVQHSGNIFYDVAPRDLGKLRVETPFLVAVIKGTQFNVAVDESGTTISLFEGSLEIRTPDDSDVIQLNAGEIAIRSLIDDSIRIVGMDDPRVENPTPDAPAAEATASTAPDEAAVGTAPGDAARPSPAPADAASATVANVRNLAVADAAAAVRETDALAVRRADADREVLAAVSRTPGIEKVDLGRIAIDRADERPLEVNSRVDIGRGAADVQLDTAIEHVARPPVDVEIDAVPDLGTSLDLGVELDTGLDSGLDLGAVVAPGADLSVDTGAVDVRLDVTDGDDQGSDEDGNLDGDLDLSDGLDLDLEVGGTVDVDVDLDASVQTPAPRDPPKGLLDRVLPLVR